MRGSEGPVRSRSRRPTRFEGSSSSRESASWTEEDDLPTPPAASSQSRQAVEARLTFPGQDDYDILYRGETTRDRRLEGLSHRDRYAPVGLPVCL